MNRVINQERPVKCIYCEHKAERGKKGDDCSTCQKEGAMIWNWLKGAKS